MILLGIIQRVKFKLFPSLITSRDYRKYLIDKGIEVGTGTFFFGPATTEVDVQRPWMIKIGKYCKIAAGVKILNHDYSRSVLRKKFGEVIGEAGKTTIGDNVFIGINSIILMNVTIGSNVIIGAGSVVTHDVPDNMIVAGSPAREIRTIDEQYALRKKHYIQEAKLLANEYFEKYHRYPSVKDMGAFWPLFVSRSRDALKQSSVYTALSGDDEKDLIEKFLCSDAPYENFDTFLEDAFKKTDIKGKLDE